MAGQPCAACPGSRHTAPAGVIASRQQAEMTLQVREVGNCGSQAGYCGQPATAGAAMMAGSALLRVPPKPSSTESVFSSPFWWA